LQLMLEPVLIPCTRRTGALNEPASAGFGDMNDILTNIVASATTSVAMRFDIDAPFRFGFFSVAGQSP
jgi:hypothetical protein